MTNVGAFNKAPGKRCFLRVIKAMCAAAAVLAVPTLGAEEWIEVRPAITVRTATPHSTIRHVSWTPETAQPRIQVYFEGDKQKWWYIRFAKAERFTKAVVEGDPTGYSKNEPLEPGVWYSFKERLPVILFLPAEWRAKASSATWEFSFGHIDDGSLSPKDARARGAEDKKVTVDKGKYSIELNWGEPAEVSSGSGNSPLELERSEKAGALREPPPFSLVSTDHLWKFVQFTLPPGMTLKFAKENEPDKITSEGGAVITSGTWHGFRERMILRATFSGPVQAVPQNLRIDFNHKNTTVGDIDEAKAAIQSGHIEVNSFLTVPVKVNEGTGLINDAIENWPVTLVVSLLSLGLVYFLLANSSQLTQRFRLARHRRNAKSHSASRSLPSTTSLRNKKSHEQATPQDRERSGLGFWGFLGFGRSKPGKRVNPVIPRLAVGNQVEPASQTGDSQMPDSQTPDSQPAAQQPSESLPSAQQVSGSQAGALQPGSLQLSATQSGATQEGAPRAGVRPPLLPDPLRGKVVEYEEGQGSTGYRPAALNTQQVRDLINGELANRSLSKTAETRVSALITQREKVLRDELAESARDEAQRLVNELGTRIDTEQQSVGNSLTKEINGLRKHLTDLIQTYEEKLQKSADSTDPDALYSKLLGHLFGNKVEDLRDGVFQEKVESVNTALNEYLKTELPRAEKLKEIKTKSDSIHQALCKLRDKTVPLNSGIDTELRKVVEAAGEIVDDIDKLQSQLQNRTPALDVRLRIPVPAHEGARYTFIEELGFAIKGELDRIRDPESYYRRRLDRLVTGDIINLAELCDKQVAGGPGRNPQVEQALQALFTAAGLRSILPKEGQDFAPAEQTLIQINANKSGKSQTVAEVVSRGFAYKDGQKEVVLRRAGVKIYR